MEKEANIFQTVNFIKESILTVFPKAMGNTTGKMVAIIRVISSRVWEMVMACGV